MHSPVQACSRTLSPSAKLYGASRTVSVDRSKTVPLDSVEFGFAVRFCSSVMESSCVSTTNHGNQASSESCKHLRITVHNVRIVTKCNGFRAFLVGVPVWWQERTSLNSNCLLTDSVNNGTSLIELKMKLK